MGCKDIATLVFSIHISSSIIETYFSKTNFIKNVYRSRMDDAVVAASMHLQQLKAYDNKLYIETIDQLDIDLVSSLNAYHTNLDEYRSKYLSARIAKPFRDDNTGVV